MTPVDEIRFYSRVSNSLEVEKVYGHKLINWLYTTKSGKLFSKLMAKAFVSKFYGLLQDYSFSRKNIKPFIDNYHIDMNEYQNGSLGDSVAKEESYSCFNDFFIRKFEEGKRVVIQEKNLMPAFAEARYLAFEEVTPNQTFPVKGTHLSAEAILQKDKWIDLFKGGPLIIARLCPVDYHRFHYPDNGKVIDYYPVHGDLYSVNPIALRARSDVFCANERRVTILETENFGKLAYIEVGATMVGKIVQSHDLQSDFQRGDEKGYFLFGASSVLLMGEKGRWKPSQDILQRTIDEVETYLHLGDVVASL